MPKLSIQMAKTLENRFVSQFKNKIGITAPKVLPLKIPDPRKGKTYKVKKWVRKDEKGKNYWYPISDAGKIKDELKLLKLELTEKKLRDNYSINASVSVSIQKEKMVIEARTLTPWKDLLRKGKNNLEKEVEVPPLSLADLDPLITMANERSTSETTYVLGIGSTSGWAEDLPEKIKEHALLRGGGPLVAIIDLYSNTMVYADEEVKPFIDYLSPVSVIEITPLKKKEEIHDVKKVKQYIKSRWKDQVYYFTSDKVAFETKVDEKFVRMAFEELLEKDGIKGKTVADDDVLTLNLDKYQWR